MILNYKHWRSLFLICLGIFIGSAFCMKWIESDFLHNDKLFTIIGLEITYPKEKIVEIFTGITPFVKSVVGYHFAFDFVFMAGVYPGIAALCMMAREKRSNKLIKSVLLSVALLQLIAFGCDIIENIYLLNWLNKPVIENEFAFFHWVVAIKWILAIFGALIAISLNLKKGLKINPIF